MLIDPQDALWFSREAVRRVDELAVERYAMPSVVLMENAARAVAQAALQMTDRRAGPVVILCGPGNNGGDGLTIARHLHNAGRCVRLVTTRALDAYSGDAGTNAEIARRMGLPVRRASDGETPRIEPDAALLIDALLGTGLTDPPRGVVGALIDAINAHPAPTLAVDIPTGLDCDEGVGLGRAVKATRTVSFVGLKRGFANESARALTGEVLVGDIGVPRELIEELGQRRGDRC